MLAFDSHSLSTSQAGGFSGCSWTGFRAGTKWLFAGVNLDTLKKETDRNTEDAVGHQPQFQSWTGSTAALPTAGFWGKWTGESAMFNYIVLYYLVSISATM